MRYHVVKHGTCFKRLLRYSGKEHGHLARLNTSVGTHKVHTLDNSSKELSDSITEFQPQDTTI